MSTGPSFQHPEPFRNKPFDALVGRCYAALRVISSAVLREHRDARHFASGPTSVLHEALARVAAQDARPKNEDQLRGVTTLVLRRVMLDRRRRHEALKRGAGARPAGFDEARVAAGAEQLTWPLGGAEAREALRAAVVALHRAHPRACEAFLLASLHELPQQHVADILKVSLPTIERDVRFARAWIADAIPGAR